MTYEHYFEQSMPMFERIIKRELNKNTELVKTLNDTDITLHMGPYENGSENV